MKITIVSADEWDGLYLNGECIWQHHDLTLCHFIEALKENGVTTMSPFAVEFDRLSEEEYDHLCDVGNLPDRLEEVHTKWTFQRT